MANDIQLSEGSTSFAFKNGDFATAISDNQHVFALCKSKKGDFKESPLVGVGIDDYLNASGVVQDLDVEIRKQIEADGANISFMQLLENNGRFDLVINAEY